MNFVEKTLSYILIPVLAKSYQNLAEIRAGKLPALRIWFCFNSPPADIFYGRNLIEEDSQQDNNRV